MTCDVGDGTFPKRRLNSLEPVHATWYRSKARLRDVRAGGLGPLSRFVAELVNSQVHVLSSRGDEACPASIAETMSSMKAPAQPAPVVTALAPTDEYAQPAPTYQTFTAQSTYQQTVRK